MSNMESHLKDVPEEVRGHLKRLLELYEMRGVKILIEDGRFHILNPKTQKSAYSEPLKDVLERLQSGALPGHLMR